MKNFKPILVICISLLLVNNIYARQDTFYFFQQTQRLNNGGMMVLGIWALTNIIIGAFGMRNNTGVSKYFHQMNFFWNTVNAFIAAYALITGLTENLLLLNNDELLAKHQTFENLFLINAGLDVLYVGAGAYMIKRSKFANKRQNLLKGYGSSIILQGSFLFVFDLIMYGIQYTRKIQFIEHTSIIIRINSSAFT
jgi:hypothetical protein